MNIENNNDQVVQLYLDDIIPNRFQPREVFDEKALKELAISIKEHGVIQPIIVRNVKGKYEIIAGERRYKATALAGLTKIPAIIRDLDDKESSKVALLENLQRKNLTPIEEARTYQKILEIDEMTQDDLAKTMGKSQSAVSNKLRLLSLPDEVQNSLLKEQISERHARALLNIPDGAKQTEMLHKIIANKMSVRAVEEEIKQTYQKEEDNEGGLKMNNESGRIYEDISVPSSSNFINSNPLMPTAEIPAEEKKLQYGEIKIVPPINNNVSNEQSKFINYGEIDDHETDEPPMAFNDPNNKPDLNALREKATDISVPKKEVTQSAADLDSLLNLQNVAVGPMMGNNNYLTPAEEIVRKDATPSSKVEKAADYFKSADFVPNMSGFAQAPVVNYTPDTASQKIRDLISELKSYGISVQVDEMNFENSYQFIVKIDK